MYWQPPIGAQNGAVLFFTLIALVAMTLAALAMVRSVDTGNLVAGNIALKQGAIQESDRIMNTAYNCLDRGGELVKAIGFLDTNKLGSQPCYQYYATLQASTKTPFGFPDVLKGELATLPSNIQKSVDSTTGNTSLYVIERMCTVAGIWQEENCMQMAGTPAKNGDEDTKNPLSTVQALYRISVRINGPRNVNAYSQMIMTAPQ